MPYKSSLSSGLWLPNNTELGGDGLVIPNWSTATRPANPSPGTMGYNATTQAVEVYLTGQWKTVVSGTSKLP